MSYFCDICDKTINLKSKNKHLKYIAHNAFEKTFHIFHSLESPEFFNVDDLFKDFINNHNKKYYFHYVKGNFFLVFDNNSFPCIEFVIVTKNCNEKRFVFGKKI